MTVRSDRAAVFKALTVRQEGGVVSAAISSPPMNLLGPALVRDLVSLLQAAEADEAVRVLVFTSTDPDYFISHVDVTQIKEYREEAARLVGEPSIGLLFQYLSASWLVSIGAAPLLLMAALVGFSQVRLGVHYSSDVLMGQLLAIVTAAGLTAAGV